jgi:hypothetical protein
MFLKAPGILVFVASAVLALTVLYARFIGLSFLASDAGEFYAMLTAYVLLVLGCTMRGL